MNGTKWDVWQILDVGSIWMREFGSAMSGQAPVLAWEPVMSAMGAFSNWERVVQIQEPRLSVHQFPLQRGYAREPFRRVIPFENRILRRMEQTTEARSERSPLICSTPFYAPVAERWRGPVIYYSTDLTAEYEGLNGVQVRNLDRRMCGVAQAVCPNSARIAEYLTTKADCDSSKITVVPNATRESNISAHALLEPGPLPDDLRDLRRPLAGVIGNLSGNMDWDIIAQTMDRTSNLNWVFVGPFSNPIADQKQSTDRARVMRSKMVRFVGSKSYGELQKYARCFDVAVLPYLRKEPTYSGSSTRFYEHLAACRPMVATRGFAELLEKVPLLTLVDTPDEMSAALQTLANNGFSDGFETARWQASRSGTWEQRARTLMATLG